MALMEDADGWGAGGDDDQEEMEKEADQAALGLIKLEVNEGQMNKKVLLD